MPLVASEPRHQQPRLLGALVSIIPHPPACPVAETEPLGTNQICCSPQLPSPNQTRLGQIVNCPGCASLLLA